MVLSWSVRIKSFILCCCKIDLKLSLRDFKCHLSLAVSFLHLTLTVIKAAEYLTVNVLLDECYESIFQFRIYL